MSRIVLTAVCLLLCVNYCHGQYTVTYAHAITICGPQGCQTVYFPMHNQHLPQRPPEVFAYPGPVPNGHMQRYHQPIGQAYYATPSTSPQMSPCGPNGCPPVQNGLVNIGPRYMR